MQFVTDLIASYPLLFYAIIAIMGVVLFGGYYLFKILTHKGKRQLLTPEGKPVVKKGKGPEPSIIDQFVAVEARVYDDRKRTIYNETIKGETVRDIRKTWGNLGRVWNYDGKPVYALNKNVDGTYQPVEVPETLENPPSRLYDALNQQEVDIVYDVSIPGNFMQKYGQILLFVGAVLFMIFAWVTQ